MAGGGSPTKVVQITNIAPQATKDQMQSLFGNIGKIEDLRLYPTIRDVSCPVVSRICYVKFQESSSVSVAQHMTNTVFIDRALIVIPVYSGIIPDEYRALEMSNNGTLVPGLYSSGSKLPPELINRIDGSVPNQVITTSDPKLSQNNLPEYPPLPVNFDARKIEETRRTIIVCDIKSDWSVEDVMDFFGQAGEVKYGRLAEKDHIRYAMIEFTDQKSIIEALKMQGTEYRGIPLNVYHCTQPILKPEAKSNEAAQKEIEEAMCIVKEAQNLISAAIDPVIGMLSKDKSSSSRRRSRSRSRERRHSRSRSRKRSKSRKRSRSRTRSKRSRSRSKKRSSSRSKRSTSRAKRSGSRSKRSRSRSKHSPSRSKRSPSRSKRSRSRTKRSSSPRPKRSRSRSKRSRSRDKRRKSRSHNRSRSKSTTVRSRRSRSHSHRNSRSRDRDRKTSSSKSHKKEEKRRRSRSRSKSKRRSRSRGRTSRNKEASSSSKSSKRRTGTPDTKKLKSILEEKIHRNYDDEEKIGLEDCLKVSEGRRGARTPSPEKSDNMDISNSP